MHSTTNTTTPLRLVGQPSTPPSGSAHHSVASDAQRQPITGATGGAPDPLHLRRSDAATDGVPDDARDAPAAVLTWVRTAASSSADPVAIAAAADRLSAWAESRRIHAIGALQTAEQRSASELLGPTLQDSGSLGRAERRAAATAAFPTFQEALAAGLLTSAHVDRLAEALRPLTSEQRATLAGQHERVLLAASASTAAEFARFLRRETNRIVASAQPSDGDPAQQRLEQQQGAIRLTSHTDRDTGMVIYRLALDPLAATQLDRQIHQRTETLFHTGDHPALAPHDPMERQQFLQAHALLHLISNGARAGASGTFSPFASSGAEIIVVVDHTVPDGPPDIDWGPRNPAIPPNVLHQLLGRPGTTTHTVVVRNGVVLEAPGRLDLGRTTRLANRAQRRALRALYRSCAVPGCDAAFDHCTIHHVRWWRHGGATDLSNLLPLCHRHHQLVHHHGWQVHLGPQRELTVTTPNRRTTTTGPPRRWAA